jgi:hypothetical protein
MNLLMFAAGIAVGLLLPHPWNWIVNGPQRRRARRVSLDELLEQPAEDLPGQEWLKTEPLRGSGRIPRQHNRRGGAHAKGKERPHIMINGLALPSVQGDVTDMTQTPLPSPSSVGPDTAPDEVDTFPTEADGVQDVDQDAGYEQADSDDDNDDDSTDGT